MLWLSNWRSILARAMREADEIYAAQDIDVIVVSARSSEIYFGLRRQFGKREVSRDRS